MKWLERYHDEKASAPMQVTWEEWRDGETDQAKLQIATMFDIALRMRPYRWPLSEITFFSMRTLLCTADARWIPDKE